MLHMPIYSLPTTTYYMHFALRPSEDNEALDHPRSFGGRVKALRTLMFDLPLLSYYALHNLVVKTTFLITQLIQSITCNFGSTRASSDRFQRRELKGRASLFGDALLTLVAFPVFIHILLFRNLLAAMIQPQVRTVSVFDEPFATAV